MTMIPELAIQSSQVARFLLEHYPPARNWADPFGYCAWYLGNGFMAVLRHDDDSIVGIGSARLVQNPGDGAIPYYYDRNGECIFIDLLVAKEGSEAMKELGEFICELWGPRKTIAYFRQPEEKLRVHSYDVWFRNFRKKLERGK
jgi:hypothetical protein